MKRVVTYLAGCSVFLLICWAIGKALHPDGMDVESGNVEVESVKEEQDQNETESENLGWHGDEYNVFFSNSQQTQDNPWGYTAGLIDTDSDGKCVLLTPATSVEISRRSNETFNEDFSLQFRIHYWVAKDSDGAVVTVSFCDQGATVIGSDVFIVGSQDEWQEHIITVPTDADVFKIRLECSGGDNNDETADWVIIK